MLASCTVTLNSGMDEGRAPVVNRTVAPEPWDRSGVSTEIMISYSVSARMPTTVMVCSVPTAVLLVFFISMPGA